VIKLSWGNSKIFKMKSCSRCSESCCGRSLKENNRNKIMLVSYFWNKNRKNNINWRCRCCQICEIYSLVIYPIIWLVYVCIGCNVIIRSLTRIRILEIHIARVPIRSSELSCFFIIALIKVFIRKIRECNWRVKKQGKRISIKLSQIKLWRNQSEKNRVFNFIL
jgi:hypothetical protein